MKVIEVELRSPATLEGDVGAAKLVQGPPGESATVEIGTVTRGEEAAVTNVGSGTHAVLDFVLPKGDKGDTGEKGDQGDLGPRGATFTPSVDMETGLLSWTNDAAMPNPEPVDIRGPQGSARKRAKPAPRARRATPARPARRASPALRAPRAKKATRAKPAPRGTQVRRASRANPARRAKPARRARLDRRELPASAAHRAAPSRRAWILPATSAGRTTAGLQTRIP
ncbi:MAG: hypothetical protein ACLTSG_05415 [Lachnospiraceae bacterium]